MPTWVEVQARDAYRDFERDDELKAAISQKLSMLAADGVTDPIELREWALESLLLTVNLLTTNALVASGSGLAAT